jgi:hypothetical protein
VTRIRSGAIEVDGLAQLGRALKDLGDDAPKELREANREVADDVAGESKSKALSLGGVAAKVAPTIKASAGTTSAGVGFGGSAAPWAQGAEFGGGRRATTKQFKPWRGSSSSRAGYFVYPTIRDNAERIEETYVDKIDALTRRLNLS